MDDSRIETLISKLEREIPNAIRKAIEEEILPLIVEEKMIPDHAVRTYVNSKTPTVNQTLVRIALIKCGFSKLIEPVNR